MPESQVQCLDQNPPKGGGVSKAQAAAWYPSLKGEMEPLYR